MTTTTFVLVTDSKYFSRARRTIIDLRCVGKWDGDIVLITIDFDLNQNFADFYRVLPKRFAPIDQKRELIQRLNYSAFLDTIDGREITKLNQWEKLHVFDPYFRAWERVVFLDAGLRVLHNVHESILKVDCKGKFLAPDDGGNYVILPNPDKLFKTQVSISFHKRLMDTLNDFGGESIMEQSYFLNCVWVYDTAILDTVSKDEMIDGILKYPVCKTNEMALMNLYIHFRHGLWERFPVKVEGCDKVLFDWCELNNPLPTSWRDYCLIKYPATISFDDV